MLYMVHKVHTIKKNNIQSNFENFHMTSINGIIIFLNLFQLQKKDVRPLNLSQAPPTVSTVKRLLLMLPLKTTNLLAKTPNKKFPKERENSKRKIPLGKCYPAFLPRLLKQTDLRLDNYLISRQISNLIPDIIEWHLFKHDIYTLFNDQEDLSDFLVDSGFYEHL